MLQLSLLLLFLLSLLLVGGDGVGELLLFNLVDVVPVADVAAADDVVAELKKQFDSDLESSCSK